MAIIDSHAHVWEKPRPEYPWSTSLGIKPAFEAPLELLLAEMSIHGVQQTVLVQPSNYGFDNSYLLDCIRRKPDTFVAIGLVDPWSHSVEQDLETLASVDRVVGTRLVAALNPDIPWLDADSTYRYWNTVEKLGFAVSVLIRPSQLQTLEALVARWPTVNVIVEHLGHSMADPVPPDPTSRTLISLARYGNVYLKVSGFPVISRVPYPHRDLFPMVQEALETFGPSRLIRGSDFPYVQRQCGYGPALDIVRHEIPFLSDVERSWVLHDTALRVWPALASGRDRVHSPPSSTGSLKDNAS